MRKKLEEHLSDLKRSGMIRVWHDRKIGAGDEWKGRILESLNSAHIILFLVSAGFLASNYCYDVEVERAMQRHDSGEARVIPIIIRSVVWENTVFAKLQALPDNAKAVTSWSDRDKAFVNIAQGIRKAIEEVSSGLTDLQAR